MPTYTLVQRSSVTDRVLSSLKMCFLNVLRLHVSQNQRQKRLYKQYMEQLAGAYVERCTDLSTWEHRYNCVGTPEWDAQDWCESEGSRSCCGSECDSGRCSSPCCSEVIFNGGQHFSGKGNACRPFPICYPGNFGSTAGATYASLLHSSPTERSLQSGSGGRHFIGATYIDDIYLPIEGVVKLDSHADGAKLFGWFQCHADHPRGSRTYDVSVPLVRKGISQNHQLFRRSKKRNDHGILMKGVSQRRVF